MSKDFFREIYPCEWLVDKISDNRIDPDLRGRFIRLINYIYIDDSPHKLLKMTRAFKAYESSNEYIEKISSTRSKYLDDNILNDIIVFIKEYIEAFVSKATGVSYIKTFDFEFVRLINYLLKYGLFIYRDNTFQIHDVDLIFSYLCHICDIFTSKSYIGSYYSLDKIISKDTIMSDLTRLDPFQRSAHDIKYSLFNKSHGNVDNSRFDFYDYEEKTNSRYFHTKILVEIITMFHMFNDLRQHYLMSNNVEFFYKNIYEKFRTADNKPHSDEEYEQMNKILINEFKHIIPDAATFRNHMKYELPSIDIMFENDELDNFKIALRKEESYDDEMHEEFVTLMIDTFNLHNYDSFLRQQIILLICRYHSERAEFIRNLDRMLLFFDDSDWRFYVWVQEKLDEFVFFSEKSNIWLLKVKNMIIDSDADIEAIENNVELIELMKILKDLKRAVVYNSVIKIHNDNTMELEFEKGDRRINVYSQDLYRNVKVYDYLINFLFQNKELLLKVRRLDVTKINETKIDIIKSIRKVFKQIFGILEVMTLNNHKTQDLMWKYKEDFIFEELGSTEQDGELELVLAIIDDSEEAIKYNQNKYSLSKTRRFVNSLNKRVGNKENFVILLEIYNKLIKFETISFLKESLVKLILQNPQEIYSYNKDSRQEFEKSLNIQEIIYSVIYNQEMIFVREFLKDFFTLNKFNDMIEKSISRLDELEIEYSEYDAQEYDELREYQYIAIINIYMQLYLNTTYSSTDKDELLDEFSKFIGPRYMRELNNFNIHSDFDDPTTFKKSKLKFLMDYMQTFLKGVRRYIENAQDDQLQEGQTKNTSYTRTHTPRSLVGRMTAVKNMLSEIDQAYNEILERLDNTDNDDVGLILKAIHSEYEFGGSTYINSKKNDQKVGITASKSIRIFKPSINSDKMTNLRSLESTNFTKVWRTYIHTIINSRETRKIIDSEHIALSTLMFETLTNKDSNINLVKSFKTFISTSIDYVYTCEKANWTLFIIIFIFKINSMLLTRCNMKSTESDYDEYKFKINSNILDSIDTLRTSNMIFKILSTSKDDSFTYSNEIFGITSYFCNKLLILRSQSVQDKFLGFFKNDSTSQHFFKQCDEYINVHMEKLRKGSLRAFYSQQKFTDELSKTCYLVDKNLEKQIVSLLRFFCSNDNREMQNYMREQTNNAKSYNMITLVTQYSSEFVNHLQYPVAFDTFKSTLDALNEFIQGPNRANQEILIQHHFVELGNALLKLEYNSVDNEVILPTTQGRSELRKANTASFNPSIKHSIASTKGSGAYKYDISGDEIILPSNNFMISLLKYKSLSILLQLLVGRSPTSYIFYLYRRIITPETFRLNFAYQSYFMKKFHKDEYNLDLFFKYDRSLDSVQTSPMIIEIGFQLYFLLMRMQDNLFNDMDEKYYKMIISLVSDRDESTSRVEKNFFKSIYYFFKDVYILIKWLCRQKKNKIKLDDVHLIQNNDLFMRKILAFYTEN